MSIGEKRLFVNLDSNMTKGAWDTLGIHEGKCAVLCPCFAILHNPE